MKDYAEPVSSRAPFRCELREVLMEQDPLEEMRLEIVCLRQQLADLSAILTQAVQDMRDPERHSVLRYIQDNLIFDTEQELAHLPQQVGVEVPMERTLGVLTRRLKFLEHIRRNLDRERLY